MDSTALKARFATRVRATTPVHLRLSVPIHLSALTGAAHQTRVRPRMVPSSPVHLTRHVMEVTASTYVRRIPSVERTNSVRQDVAPRITVKTSNARKAMCASAAIVTKGVRSRIVRQEASATTRNSAPTRPKIFARPHNAATDHAIRAYALTSAPSTPTAEVASAVTTGAVWTQWQAHVTAFHVRLVSRALVVSASRRAMEMWTVRRRIPTASAIKRSA